MQTLILGSQSPRRKEILAFFNLPFMQVAPNFDEESAPVLDDPAAYAESLARGKALSIKDRYPDAWILGADTVVHMDGKYYAKPKDRHEALQFLKEFSGRWQTVITGIALVHGKHVDVGHERTKVLFNKLSDKEMNHYLDSNTWQDKAGGYTIVGASSLLVEKIDGCFYNVMGLPVNTLKRLFVHAGYHLWAPS